MNYTDMMEDLLEKSLEMITAAEQPLSSRNIRQHTNSEEATVTVHDKRTEPGFERSTEQE